MAGPRDAFERRWSMTPGPTCALVDAAKAAAVEEGLTVIEVVSVRDEHVSGGQLVTFVALSVFRKGD